MINVMGARRLVKASFNKKVKELREKANKKVIEMAKVGYSGATFPLNTYEYTLDVANAVIAKFKAKGFNAELTEDLVDDTLLAYEMYTRSCSKSVNYWNYYSVYPRYEKKSPNDKPMMSYEEFEVWYRKNTSRPKKYVISIKW